MRPTKESTIIICGIVRNAERGLRRNIPVIDRFCGKFRDYSIVIYENDSTDRTKNLLIEWQKRDPEHIIISLNDTGAGKAIPSDRAAGTVNPYFSRKRISKMAAYRNKYLDIIRDRGLSADYMLVVDLDVARLYEESLLSSFNTDNDWDAVCSFGYSTSPKLRRRYHDSYAFCEEGKGLVPQTEDGIIEISEKYADISSSDKWIRIDSGFGGAAIYRFDAIKGLRYQVIDNDDPRVEVRCEHFSICRQMIEAGFPNIYLNPAMVIKYQDITLGLVLRSLAKIISH